MKKLFLLALLFLLLLAGCIDIPPQKPAIPPERSIRPEAAARMFFDALNEGDYQAAADLYGGSYEVLAGMNPDLDPTDKPALLGQGCQFNGFTCLRMGEVLSNEETNPGEYNLVVQFQTTSGEIFLLGLCCGADETEMPPVSDFPIRLIRDEFGNFMVQDLPPYVP
jgi:hypothetical protein